MKRPPIPAVVLALLMVAPSSWAEPTSSSSPPTHAAPRDLDAARAHFGRGVQLYREGDFRAALAEFNRANDLGPSYRILYNIGQAQVELRDYPSARKTFTRYLKDGGDEIEPAKRDEVRAVIAICSERVAEVTVRSNRPEAELFVDDVSLGEVPLGESLVVGAGRRKIVAIVPGLPPVARVIEVTGGDRVTVELTFDEPLARVEPRTEEPVVATLGPPPAPARRDATPLWVSVAATSVFGAATVTSGILALSAKARLDAELDRFPSDAAHTASARTSVKTMSLATDAFAAATLLGLGATTYFALTRRPAPRSVQVGFGLGTLSAKGAF